MRCAELGARLDTPNLPDSATHGHSRLSEFNGQIDLPVRRDEVTRTHADLFAAIKLIGTYSKEANHSVLFSTCAFAFLRNPLQISMEGPKIRF
jgi:hypothetical protein